MVQSFRTDRSWQTVQTQIRLQSDQRLHCSPLRLHLLDSLIYDNSSYIHFLHSDWLTEKSYTSISSMSRNCRIIFLQLAFKIYSIVDKCSDSKIKLEFIPLLMQPCPNFRVFTAKKLCVSNFVGFLRLCFFSVVQL